MKSYKFLLLDLDGTLLDFDATEREALRICFEAHGIPHTEEVVAAYQGLNNELWAACERGELTKEVLVANRFVPLLEQLNIPRAEDDRALEEAYQLALRDGSYLIEGAAELCGALERTGRFQLYAMSNGVAATQNGRMDSSGLRHYFADIFVSGDTGWQKPMPEFFRHCFERIPDFEQSAALLIGDSLTADIRGGMNMGLDTVWFNPSGAPLPADYEVTYEIRSLAELPGILGV